MEPDPTNGLTIDFGAHTLIFKNNFLSASGRPNLTLYGNATIKNKVELAGVLEVFCTLQPTFFTPAEIVFAGPISENTPNSGGIIFNGITSFSGNPTYTLQGNNSYTLGTTVNGALLRLAPPSSGTTVIPSDLTLNPGSQLDIATGSFSDLFAR